MNEGRGNQKVYTVEELAKLLGVDKHQKNKKHYLPKGHQYEVTDRNDPKGNQWVNVPNVNDWRKHSDDTW